MYVAGHNVIIYNLDDKTQYFIAGSEITEAINHIAVSHKSQLLAICERSKKAQLTIYNLVLKKKQRVITGDEPEC